MAQAGKWQDHSRIKSGLGVALLHALLGYAFVTGLGYEVPLGVSDRLKVFNVPEEPPPPPVEEPVPPAPKAPEPEGRASPPNLKANPSPVVAPPPRLRLDVPPPLVAAPAPGTGSEASAGASDVAGPGFGAGGLGDGLGSGGRGSGTGGGGGAAVRARLVGGRIVHADYPRAAWRAKAEGSVVVRFTVGVDGRAGRCAVTTSSGNDALDATTCRLIEQRFRYEPARDARGRPVAELRGWKQDWWLE